MFKSCLKFETSWLRIETIKGQNFLISRHQTAQISVAMQQGTAKKRAISLTTKIDFLHMHSLTTKSYKFFFTGRRTNKSSQS